MENTFKNSYYKTVNYLLNSSTGYYEKQPIKITFNKLPNDLKVEESKMEFLKKQGANEIIRGRIKNGKYLFFTGLIPLSENLNVYFGNHAETFNKEKKTSLIVFAFSENDSKLTVYFFNHFYIFDRPHRIAFVSDFIKSLNQ
jgi:hypothetical protein